MYGNDEPRGAANLPPSRPYVEKSKGRTRQEDLEGTDINRMMKRYEKTGVLTVEHREALFIDASQITTYREAVDKVMTAEEAFMRLPADVRTRFKNNASEFIDFTSNQDNRQEMIDMGLLEPEGAQVVPQEPAAAPPEPTPAAPAAAVT